MTYLNKAQRLAIKRKFDQNSDGAKTYREFRSRVSPSFQNEYVMLNWCGMWLGIERDGYTHS